MEPDLKLALHVLLIVIVVLVVLLVQHLKLVVLQVILPV